MLAEVNGSPEFKIASTVGLGKLKAKETDSLISVSIILAVLAAAGFFPLKGFTSSSEIILERKGARVHPGPPGAARQIPADSPPGRSGSQITEVEPIPPDRLDRAAWFHQALRGP